MADWLSELLRNDMVVCENYEYSSFVRRLDENQLKYLIDALESLNLLPFERLNLIDVELLERPCVQRRETNTVVSLEKELRVTFRVPVTEEDYLHQKPTKKCENDFLSVPPGNLNDASSSGSSSSSSSFVDGCADKRPSKTPTIKRPSRIPLLVKTKMTSCSIPKNNLHITVTNQVTKNYSKKNVENHFKYEKRLIFQRHLFVTVQKKIYRFFFIKFLQLRLHHGKR